MDQHLKDGNPLYWDMDYSYGNYDPENYKHNRHTSIKELTLNQKSSVPSCNSLGCAPPESADPRLKNENPLYWDMDYSYGVYQPKHLPVSFSSVPSVPSCNSADGCKTESVDPFKKAGRPLYFDNGSYSYKEGEEVANSPDIKNFVYKPSDPNCNSADGCLVGSWAPWNSTGNSTPLFHNSSDEVYGDYMKPGGGSSHDLLFFRPPSNQQAPWHDPCTGSKQIGPVYGYVEDYPQTHLCKDSGRVIN
jgi:hypothetical protein